MEAPLRFELGVIEKVVRELGSLIEAVTPDSMISIWYSSESYRYTLKLLVGSVERGFLTLPT